MYYYSHNYYNYYHINTIHRNIQGMSKRPREGACLASKALATVRTREKSSLL